MPARRSMLRLGATAAMVASLPLLAQSRRGVIRFLCPFAAGATYDLLTRAVADAVGKSLARAAIVDNRPGAGGLIAVRALRSAPPDGTTLLQTSGSFVSLPVFMKEARFDPAKDFVPVAAFCETFSLVLAHASLPASNMKELVAYARANPGAVTAGTAGPNTSGDIWTAILARRAEADILRVPYKGAAPMLLALESGEVKVAITTYTEALRSSVHAGRLKLLAVTSPRRVPALPDVPTVSESLSGYAIEGGWVGLHAATGTSASEVQAISAAVKSTTESASFQAKLAGVFAEARYQDPVQFARTAATTKATWERIALELGVKPA